MVGNPEMANTFVDDSGYVKNTMQLVGIKHCFNIG